MKMQLKIDERNLSVWRRVLSVLHSFTALALVVMFLYRHYISGQSFEDIWDIGCLMILNGLFLSVGVLYLGGVNFEKIRIKWLAVGYLVFLVIMFLFMSFIDTFVEGTTFDFYSIADRMPIIAIVSGVIMLVFVFFAVMGKQKIDKDLE